MGYKELLEELDNIDINMLNNLNNNVFRNSNDIQVRMGLSKLETFKTNMPEMQGYIKERFENTYQAYLAAMGNDNKNINVDTYFSYINSLKKMFENGISNPDEAIEIIVNAVNSRHVPNEYAINYILAHQGAMGLTAEQQKTFEQIVPVINLISQENEAIEKGLIENQSKALIVPEKKLNIFQKIKNFFTKKNNPSIESKKTPIPENKKARNFREAQKVSINSQMAIQKSKEPEYVAISDLHGNMDKWNMVKKLISENPNIKIIMLGDAMDRGNFGPEILLQIKEFSDSGKLQYLPGNHDIFAYNYIKMRKKQKSSPFVMAEAHLEHNGGEITMEKLNNFSTIVNSELAKGNIREKISLDELADWLGAQPIQKKMKIDDYNFALAHAIFDEKLYEQNPAFNLADALELENKGQKESEAYKRFYTTMWYREGDIRTQPIEPTLPENNVVVVGHTRQPEINIDFKKPKSPIVYIDTGKGKLSGFNLNRRKSISLEEQDRTI